MSENSQQLEDDVADGVPDDECESLGERWEEETPTPRLYPAMLDSPDQYLGGIVEQQMNSLLEAFDACQVNPDDDELREKAADAGEWAVLFDLRVAELEEMR